MQYKKLEEKLEKIGFSKYEARAYLALLKKNPVTGYELANISGIPNSKIYEVINKLLDRSIIIPTGSKPNKYIPQDYQEFLRNIRDTFLNDIDYIEKHFLTLRNNKFDYIWNIDERQEFLRIAKEMLVHSEKNILLLGWDQELQEIMDELVKKTKLKIGIVQFGSMPINIGVLYNHGIEKVLEREKRGRLFTLTVDATRMIHGIISEEGQVRGIYSSHPSLVDIATDYIKHEIYTTKMYDNFAEAMDDLFGGENLPKLRDIWKRYT